MPTPFSSYSNGFIIIFSKSSFAAYIICSALLQAGQQGSFLPRYNLGIWIQQCLLACILIVGTASLLPRTYRYKGLPSPLKLDCSFSAIHVLESHNNLN